MVGLRETVEENHSDGSKSQTMPKNDWQLMNTRFFTGMEVSKYMAMACNFGSKYES
jgi:hypothetical protein